MDIEYNYQLLIIVHRLHFAPTGPETTPFPVGYTPSGQLANLGNTTFANFRPQYSLPGAATTPGAVQAAFPGIPPMAANPASK